MVVHEGKDGAGPKVATCIDLNRVHGSRAPPAQPARQWISDQERIVDTGLTVTKVRSSP